MITLREYQEFVRNNWLRRFAFSSLGPAYDNLKDIFIAATGLAGEVGEVLELVKKHQRDGHIDDVKLVLELGDVQHYLTKIAQKYGFSLEDIMAINKLKLESRAYYGKDHERECEIAMMYLAGRLPDAEMLLPTGVLPTPVAHIEKPEFPCHKTREIREVERTHVPDDPIGETYDHDRSCPGD